MGRLVLTNFGILTLILTIIAVPTTESVGTVATVGSLWWQYMKQRVGRDTVTVTSNSTNETSPNPNDVPEIQHISRIVGSSFKMPCFAQTYDDITYILWKNASSGEHLMSYISSKPGELKFSIPASSKLKERIYYPNWPSFSIENPPFVEILKVETGDAGLYQCRILYRRRGHVVLGKVLQLHVIRPTTRMTIKEEVLESNDNNGGSGKQLDSNDSMHSKDGWVTLSSDHYIENQNLTLICTAFDGNPPPKLTWRSNGMGGVIDNTSEVMDGYLVKNELTLVKLGIQHFLSVFTCEASHSDVNDSNSIFATLLRHVKLNIYLSPKSIELNIPIEMKAGENYSLSCGAVGAYPRVRTLIILEAKYRWFKIQESYPEKEEAYSITFTPDPSDDGRTVVCRVDNPYLAGMGFQTVEAKRQLRVLYPPGASITLASKNVSRFSLGDSLLLECRVQCVPAANKIEWFINDKPAENGKHVAVMGSTLLISSLTNFLASINYTCQATNSLGVGTSPVFTVNLRENLKNSKRYGSIPLSEAKDILYLDETDRAETSYSGEEYDKMQGKRNFKNKTNSSGSGSGSAAGTGNEQKDTMLIIIASLAGVADVIILVLLVVYLLKKRRSRLQKSKTENPQNPNTTLRGPRPGELSNIYSSASGSDSDSVNTDDLYYSTCLPKAAFDATRPLPPIPGTSSRAARDSDAGNPIATEL